MITIVYTINLLMANKSNNKLIDFIDTLSDDELWLLYGETIKKLKERSLIRTRNIVGERGEFLVIKLYNETKGMPNLQAAPEGTQNVDALSRKGERYSIKTVSEPNTTTGVFYGCGDKKDGESIEKKFEYVIIVQIAKDFTLKKIIELTWDQFIKYRRWHSTMRAWNLSLTKEVLSAAKVISG
jgi:hypothetical protein